ncbi:MULTISPECIES: GerAB/ArcD/ProY family transporter [Priestia]|uniref:Spore germination protein KB n=1 Tax=Priestia aryabhattai TaxID=412384 RepID=A0A7W3NDP3_PRIAR|nr:MULTISPECIES: GerAB/ArcD/ProY family transporter [Priestia]MDP9576803.1 spore germination protein KB [Bacillus sp. 1751]MBA9041023.1 spore germination protein KB [Priestia aryabhattai]MBD8112773.1 GerAB/ArcD/ProY family transporter [Priestia megaterium]MBU8585256.1 GerAB/ArcD/ProY family transporter [Priestia megaterium]MDH2359690.1 GerAB/ArcD/ProY family transporter [Priestia megaterium]
MIALVIVGFVKINVFFYAVIVGLSTLFKVKRPSALTYPVGTVILFFSWTIASNVQEHLKEGLTIMPVLLFIPFHLVIPFTLLCIAFIKHRIKNKRAAAILMAAARSSAIRYCKCSCSRSFFTCSSCEIVTS